MSTSSDGTAGGPRLLGGRYELGPEIGRGGMAEVHIGRDTRLDRRVAIKVLRADLARDPSFQTRFRREAQASASLNHHSIVSVYDTGEETNAAGQPAPYIVMEFVTGRTLREILNESGRLMPRRAMEITAEICAALDYSHRAGIVHRDIKPGNVMITPEHTVKVMDFGIARAITDSSATVTATAQVIGTAQYLSPEQARGENVDARSDVYSTGCLLYELVTGMPPFSGDSAVSVAYQHVREDPAPPTSVNPQLPPDLDRVVLKAMAKNPANRYQSAGDMRADLQRALAGQAVAAEPVLSQQERTALLARPAAAATATTVDRSGQDRRRQRAIGFGLLAAAVVGLFVAAAVVLPHYLGKSSPAGPGTAISPTPRSSAPKPTAAARVAVPKLTGLTVEQATMSVQLVGLKLGTPTMEVSSAGDKGKVLRQAPDFGSQAPRGTAVDITVGSGPPAQQQTTVPQLVGLSLDAAKSQLRSSHLAFGGAVSQANTAAAGTVLRSTPNPGQPVPVDTQVTLVVSSGKIPVPSVYNQTEAAARATLSGKGFNNVNVMQRTSSSTPGTVIDQNPQPGTEASPDTTITLTLAQPPSSSASAPSTPPSSQPSSSPPVSSSSPSPTPPPTSASSPSTTPSGSPPSRSS